jgi:hypothetical protein
MSDKKDEIDRMRREHEEAVKRAERLKEFLKRKEGQ